MKKIALALLLLPAISFADNVNYFNYNYAMLDSDSDSDSDYGNAKAFELSLQSVLEEKLSIFLSFLSVRDGKLENDRD
jgi:hypothetical protein